GSFKFRRQEGSMTKALSFMIALVAFLSFVDAADAASRLGGGRSSGMQRQITPQQAPRPPQQATPNTPAPQKAAPATPPTPQPQASGWRRWLGPLAGLAIGAGIASLFFHNGMGGALLGMLLVAALVMGVFILIRMFRGGRTEPQRPLQYAGAGAGAPRTEPTITPPSMPI